MESQETQDYVFGSGVLHLTKTENMAWYWLRSWAAGDIDSVLQDNQLVVNISLLSLEKDTMC